MRINTIVKNYKIKLIFLFSFILLLITVLLPKEKFKENLAQNIRIQTCQPNFTNIYDTQIFKIKRLLKGAINFAIKGCEHEKIKINISFSNYAKIKKDRLKALKSGTLINPEKVPATIVYQNETFKAKIRLKGDLASHWAVNKQWSLKIELRNGKSINGMKEFSITKLKERAFPGNLIIRNQQSRMGLISPNFKIYKININGSDEGLMIAEEQFSNVFLENRRLKDSLIFKLTNDVNLKIDYLSKLNIDKKDSLFKKQGKIEVDIYNKKKIDEEEYLRDHETLIKSINVILNSEYSDSEKSIMLKNYFNVEKFAKLLANSISFTNFHSLWFTNLRFYLNPYTLKVEPIPTDNMYLKPFQDLSDYTKKLKSIDTLNAIGIIKIFWNDKDFISAYKKSLNQIKFDLDKIRMDSVELCSKFEDYCRKTIDFKDLEKHILELLKKGEQIFPRLDLKNVNKKDKINLPTTSITSDELKIFKIFNTYIYARLFNEQLKVYNLTSNDINLKNIDLYYNQKNISSCKTFKKKNCTVKTHNLNFKLDKTVQDLSHKEIKLNLKNNKKSIVWAKINGSVKNKNFSYSVKVEKKEFDTEFFINKKKYNKKHLSNLINKTFVIGGKLLIEKPIIVPKNYNLTIKPGSELIFKNKSYIYLNHGNLILDGNDKQIVLKTNEEYWGGIYVNNAPGISKINNTKIISIKNFEHEGIFLTGAVNFYRSNIEIFNTTIIDNKSEDALNIIKSNFKIKNTLIKNTLSDGIDSDFSNGLIKNTFFKNIGGDAIDTSGSNVTIVDTTIHNVKDKALSAGENSKINIENLKIDSSTFGLVSKDLSTINGTKINITNSIKFDVMAFEKKKHFGPGFINIKEAITKNQILSQTGSKIIINNKLINTENFDIKDFY